MINDMRIAQNESQTAATFRKINLEKSRWCSQSFFSYLSYRDLWVTIKLFYSYSTTWLDSA